MGSLHYDHVILLIYCRDIKPANVLITADGQAVLMDLGSCDQARAVIRTARDGQRLQDDAAERCTMPFRAPELFNVQTGDDISEATDIWVGDDTQLPTQCRSLRHLDDFIIILVTGMLALCMHLLERTI